jgi:hypothetical protein
MSTHGRPSEGDGNATLAVVKIRKSGQVGGRGSPILATGSIRLSSPGQCIAIADIGLATHSQVQ